MRRMMSWSAMIRWASRTSPSMASRADGSLWASLATRSRSAGSWTRALTMKRTSRSPSCSRTRSSAFNEDHPESCVDGAPFSVFYHGAGDRLHAILGAVNEVSAITPQGAGEALSIGIIGVPVDLGGNRRGTDMGPSALRYARLARHLEALGHSVRDYGNLDIPIPETRPPGDHTRRYFEEIVALWHQLAGVTEDICRSGGVPLVLGGDHSLSVGALAGVDRVHQQPGILWIDAHADMNNPTTTPSSNIHGMSLAATIGATTDDMLAALPQPLPLPPERAVLIGARDLDEPEKEKVRSSGVTVFTMKDIDEMGIAAVVRRA